MTGSDPIFLTRRYIELTLVIFRPSLPNHDARMGNYFWLKHIHMTCAGLSLTGFILRGYWMQQQSPRLQHPLTRTLPHIIDTLLLLSAIGLTLILGQYPFTAPWLTAKVTALLLYILLGSLAIKRGPSLRIRIIAFYSALAVFGYILSVALTHSPWPLRVLG